ncbi:MAG: transglutaminase domain-containing protein [Dehalococcoidales bacterium]|nr:transglutaminase domain-containing protein [Dehalococcoidales bacterium]
MKRFKLLAILISLLVIGLATTHPAGATPSARFTKINGEVFDDWGVCRTRASGEDGFYQVSETSFRPVIAYESLGENTTLAYQLGEQLAAKYQDRTQRAEAIFRLVRDKVRYTTDIDLFKCDEFAQNADELATTIDQSGVGYGDCEDSAILLAVMYKGAGFRSAITIVPGHTASLVYLPDYDKATAVFELDGEPGWVWAEATGKNNPLGWVPKEFINTKIAAYEIGDEVITRQKPAAKPATAVAPQTGQTSSRPFPLLGVFGFLWLLSLFRRRRRAR